MELNLDKWKHIEEIRRSYDDFISNLKKIRDIKPELEKDLSPVKSELQGKRDILVQKLFPAGNILEVYSQDYAPGKKAKILLSGQKRLESLNNNALLDHAVLLHKTCERHMQTSPDSNGNAGTKSTGHDIKRYGLTGDMLDELHTASHQFQSTLKLKDDIITYRNKTRRKLEGLIRANRKLLESRLNKLMTVFSGTHPSFYNEYHRISTGN